MTIQEAREWINPATYTDKYRKTCVQKGEKMADLIDRQVAIETVEEWFFNLDDNRVPKEVLLEMPSAQPEIIRCKDCENWDTTWQNDWAKNYHYCPLVDGIRKDDFYCADAERRTDEPEK